MFCCSYFLSVFFPLFIDLFSLGFFWGGSWMFIWFFQLLQVFVFKSPIELAFDCKFDYENQTASPLFCYNINSWLLWMEETIWVLFSLLWFKALLFFLLLPCMDLFFMFCIFIIRFNIEIWNWIKLKWRKMNVNFSYF